MSVLFDPEDEIDHIAEFADSGVRIFQRRGSLVGVQGSYGLKRWLYRRWRNNGNAIYTFVGSLLTIAGWCLNRAMGVPAPVWAAPR